MTLSVSVDLFTALSAMLRLKFYCRKSSLPCPDPAVQYGCKMQSDLYDKKPFCAQANIFQSIILSGWVTSLSHTAVWVFCNRHCVGSIPLEYFAMCTFPMLLRYVIAGILRKSSTGHFMWFARCYSWLEYRKWTGLTVFHVLPHNYLTDWVLD